MKLLKTVAVFVLGLSFFSFGFSAQAEEIVQTYLKIVKLEKGQEKLVSAPKIESELNREAQLSIHASQDCPAILVKIQVKKNDSGFYDFLSVFEVDGKKGQFLISHLEKMDTQASMLLETQKGTYRIGVQSHLKN
ncbi:hypothetical protein COW36_17485 [bacterium (Candidatus Blackallbacteria) CG17_big_fil_post_rev_8_21_14_2_50_48_46]|uniref:Uncharacterized protein n=1 Tax=bacterium (Candidatus Blackallbacteria) CG17_big_fil_post_rev_8_21_14_2_50_48_46 TaxID=2014261 RepID=A0A2M7G0G2_9BACT|nr:MAG: hypothetical protein COW64_01245 [bacterium (Candidatus Blackallbacteria) CG18_big_fil_WC_8_21_14_2_50_49_26]PIW15214.1 MAG: hypothetical protein COW36_17485 [bacterium (Candidatus Blackallbacteria) CG17_big_fil_post_rev_8_21_14_2_50_48_46]PIW44801.1 MAG: hypothetical protein COW20_22820 [bacterium (Candidatus Blackallbacteria) CG13_big_fil_rev_8_21_14_2_50_49_14]